jgi:uncharacterized membrane protein
MMAQTLIVTANILHTLATIEFVGFYLVMTTIILPVFTTKTSSGMETLSEISKRSRWWLYSAMVVLALTGTYLTIVDGNYAGIGNFNSAWAILMLIKHIVMLLMVVLGFWFNAIKRVGAGMLSTSNASIGLLRLKRYCYLMNYFGIGILFFTAIGQVL